MAEVIWAEPALHSLQEVTDYISLDNPKAAEHLVRSIFKRIEHLESHPKSGKLVIEFKNSVYKEVVFPPCRIFFRLENECVYIIHILREEQLLHLDILKIR